MPYPTDYRYTREHEWISMDGTIGSIGITDYAQNSLGDIVFVDAPKVGDTVTANATFGSVESVKAVSDLFSPVTGKVTAVNEELKTAARQDQPGSARHVDHQSGACRTRPSWALCSTRRRMRRLSRKKTKGKLSVVSDQWSVSRSEFGVHLAVNPAIVAKRRRMASPGSLDMIDTLIVNTHWLITDN